MRQSVRLGNELSFSEAGGVEIEENWDQVKSVTLPTGAPASPEALAPLTSGLPLELRPAMEEFLQACYEASWHTKRKLFVVNMRSSGWTALLPLPGVLRECMVAWLTLVACIENAPLDSLQFLRAVSWNKAMKRFLHGLCRMQTTPQGRSSRQPRLR